MLLSHKIYDYDGTEILVYSGRYHHYVKINGTVCDEHNTVLSFSPIKLSCTLDNNDLIEATVSLTNRIALKINNKLYTNYCTK